LLLNAVFSNQYICAVKVSELLLLLARMAADVNQKPKQSYRPAYPLVSRHAATTAANFVTV